MDKNIKNIKMDIKRARLWTVDGSFFTEDKETVLKLIGNDFINGKKDYTILDNKKNIIALAQIFYNE